MQTICKSSDPDLIICEVSKLLASNSRRSCAHETIRVLGKKLTKLTKRKSWKKNLRIMSKQYAHLHTMAKTSVKFQNDWSKTVGGVALTRHPLTIRVLGKNWLSLQSEKSWKKSENYEQTICTSTHYGQNICEVSKWLAKNCKRSCAHETPTDYKGFR